MRDLAGRVAIVGGCGFIGSRLANAFARQGVSVTVLDVAEPPADLDPRCRVEHRDITDERRLRGAFVRTDTVFALAAKLVKLCEEDPSVGWATNVTGLRNVLEETLRSGPAIRVVFTSSAAVYDRNVPVPTPETASLHPRGVYGASKIAGEGMVGAAAVAGGGSAVVFRPFTVYGPGPACGARGHFIAHWLEQAIAGIPLSLHYGGQQTVDLGYVEDVVQALQAARGAGLRPGQCAIYNVGSGVETRVGDVARWLAEVMPSVRTTNAPSPRESPSRQCADISRARAELGFAPRTRPEDGVKSLMAHRLGVAVPL
jgi:nucleoside-diphosphate-sugar epimerase